MSETHEKAAQAVQAVQAVQAKESDMSDAQESGSVGYLRVYTDNEGETHFEDVQVDATERGSGVSSGRSLYSALIPVEGVVLREVRREHGHAEAHPAPRSQFVVHLEGEVEVEVSDGEVRRVGPETVVLVDDTHGKGHITRSVGKEPRRTLMIPLAQTPGIVGTWQLRSWRAVTADSEELISEPFGSAPVGYITFTPGGVMHGQMMAPDRPRFTHERTTAVDFDAGDPHEIVAAFNSYLGYSGRYEVDGDLGRVTTVVECASIPDWIGSQQVRYYRINGNDLVIRTPVRHVNGVDQIGLLTFKRVTS